MERNTDRRKALFTDSRLYRQSNELSINLLQRAMPEDPLQALHGVAFTGVSNFTVRQPRQLDKPIRQLSNHLAQLARRGSAYQFIPALHEAVPKFYKDQIGAERFWVGSALKLAAGSLWTEMMAQRAVGSKNSQALVDLVIAAGALDQMLIAKMLLTSTVGEGELVYQNGELRWNDSFDRARMLFARAFYRRGEVQRIADLLSEAIFDGKGALTQLAWLRLTGSMEPVLGRPESLFRVLSNVADRGFWAGVWARLTLAALTVQARGAIYPEDVMSGIAVLEETAIGSQMDEASTIDVQNQIASLFWQQEWRRKLDLFDLRNSFVARPVMRIDRMREVFVTSVFTILDSLTFYFEQSTYDLQTDERFGRPQSVYKEIFSRPFEDRIENYIRSRGFRAGHVSDAGGWATQNGTVGLRQPSGIAPPGEIDVLGIGSDDLALIIECKCLKLPHNESRLQTLLGGLGEDDAAGYLGKLSRKATWFHDTTLGARAHHVLPVLVTDYPINFRSWETNGVVIVDEELLPALINEYIGRG
jgi:hypothetical protein